MLKYLVILLSDSSVSYCNYEVAKNNLQNESIWISEDNLKNGIDEGLKQNLLIQFVYPHSLVPERLQLLIDSVRHINIMPLELAKEEDLQIADSLNCIPNCKSTGVLTVRVSLNELMNNTTKLISIIKNALRVNIILKDMAFITEKDASEYGDWLEKLALELSELYLEDKYPQLNILTDRIFLNEMRNCNAGVDTITLAPDGKYYICPAFYYNDKQFIGGVDSGLDIANQRLYELGNAPICKICDSWHCRRCVWMNYYKTRELNTPGHIQCVLSHYERRASAKLRNILTNKGKIENLSEIPELDYLDPICKFL